MRNNIAPGEVVVSWNPRVVALYTERLSAYYPPATDPVVLGKYLEKINAKWILVFARSDNDAQWLSPYVASHPGRFEPVWRNQDFPVYHVRTEHGPTTPDNPAGYSNGTQRSTTARGWRPSMPRPSRTSCYG